MPISKQDYYEGAALCAILRRSEAVSVKFVSPFFVFDGHVHAYLKYSTSGRSPWPFTFAPDEQQLLHRWARAHAVIIALICGSDGIAALAHSAFLEIASPQQQSFRISCYREHKSFYRLRGPDGWLGGAIAPSQWNRLLTTRG